VPESRTIDEYNMIMFIIQDVANSEDIVLDAINLYKTSIMHNFRVEIIIFSSLIIIILTAFSLGLVKQQVVSPIK